jgi:uncharacterized protein YchJ
MGSSLSYESALTKGGRAMPHPIEPCPCGAFKLYKDCCGKAK